MSNLWQAIKNAVNGEANVAADAITNDRRNAELAIQHETTEYNHYQSAVVDLLAAIKEKQKRSAEAYARVVTFSSVAQQAAAAGNEADVTAAVQQKQAAEAEVATLTADIAQEQGVLDQMKANLARVRKEIDDAHVQLTELVARQQGAALQQELSKADLTIGGNTLHDQISTLKTHVEHTEAEAAASAELDGETEASTTKALVDRYGPQHKDVDSEVQALMASAKAG